jgi:hypothetical protein
MAEEDDPGQKTTKHWDARYRPDRRTRSPMAPVSSRLSDCPFSGAGSLECPVTVAWR